MQNNLYNTKLCSCFRRGRGGQEEKGDVFEGGRGNIVGLIVRTPTVKKIALLNVSPVCI